MRTLIFLISLAITISLVFAMNQRIPHGADTIPPLGKLLNPFTGLWQNKADDNWTTDTLSMKGLSDEVQIVYDKRLVPHIFAQNDLDLHFAQGYTTARHRLFQMELSTRATAGRLSEVLGSRTLEYDKLQRRKGMVWAAQNTLNEWKKSTEGYPNLQAYVKGVNAYIHSLEPKDYPVEYKILDHSPEEWTELKTALFIKQMAYVLSSREDDAKSTNALAAFGREAFDFMYPEHNPKTSPVIPASKKWDFSPSNKNDDSSTDKNLSFVPNRPFDAPPINIGSNNWAVSGTKTASGYPILCNDPHLKLTLPSTWFELQLHTPDMNVYGVSLPGIPGVIIGFNENIAWGVTNVGHDVLDWYRINWAESNKESYFLDGKIKEVEQVIESIKVRDQGIVLDTIKRTVWGPVVQISSDEDQQDLAIKWLAHNSSTPNELKTFSLLAKAKNYDDYYNALRNYTSPAQNMIFASREGDIALRVQGRFPIKKQEQGRFIMDGDKSANDWSEYIPYDQIPSIKNPKRGFVASANQRSTSSDYPYYYNGRFGQYRGRILNRILSKMDNITPDDMVALQNSNFSIKAEEALPLLIKHVNVNDLDERDQIYLNHLKIWNYKYEAEGIAPTLFETWFKAFYKGTWDEVLKLEEAKKIDILHPQIWRTIALLKEDPNNKYFDNIETKKIETAKHIAHQAFKDMSNVIQNMEADNQSLEWYQYRNASISHLLRVPAFSRSKIKVGGSGDALNAVRGSNGYLGGYGPSWRMIVAFNETGVDAVGIYPGGQSGDPSSIFYDNMIKSWATGKYHKLDFLKSPDDLPSKKTLFIQNLEPAQ